MAVPKDTLFLTFRELHDSFFAAVKDGDLQQVRQFLEDPQTKDKIDINARDIQDGKFDKDFYKSALMLAAERNFCGIIQLLLDKNADCNQWLGRDYPRTAVMLAAGNGHIDALEVFKKYIDLAYCHPGQKPYFCALYYAAEARQLDTVKFLLLNGCSINVKCLYYDVKNVNRDNTCYHLIYDLYYLINYPYSRDINLERLIEKLIGLLGKDFIKRICVNYETSTKISLLLKAIQTDNKHFIRLLIDANANIDMQEKDCEFSPFDMAIRPDPDSFRFTVSNIFHPDPYIKALFCIAKVRKILETEKQRASTVLSQDLIFRISELLLWTVKEIGLVDESKILKDRLSSVINDPSLISAQCIKGIAVQFSENKLLQSLRVGNMLLDLISCSSSQQPAMTQIMQVPVDTKDRMDSGPKQLNSASATGSALLTQFKEATASVNDGAVGSQRNGVPSLPAGLSASKTN